MSRECKISPNNFCYICGQYTVKNQKRDISSKIKELYQSYFEEEIGDQDKEFAPHIVCITCVANLTKWSRNQLKNFPLINQWCGRDKTITLMIAISVRQMMFKVVRL